MHVDTSFELYILAPLLSGNEKHSNSFFVKYIIINNKSKQAGTGIIYLIF